MYILLFIFGLAIGSFINVVALRYREGKSIFADIYGRSHCPHCGKTLRWYELMPLVSFVIQGGRCRSCHERISWQYPIVELIAGLILVLVPYRLMSFYHGIYSPYLPIFIWVIAFLTLLLIAAIDFRKRIIPDSLTIFIASLGVAMFFIHASLGDFGLSNGLIGGTFLGSYALILFWGSSLLVNTLLGLAFGLVFVGLVYILSRGRGIGFGDVKLAAATGLLMGWPDIALALILAFIIGGIIGGLLMLLRHKSGQDSVPFGPFIAAGITLVFFLGYDILNAYFYLFKL
ncbi:MAG: prepilin peptidase [Patescibacteria group bacterium]|nr:prepilin peptidase [Patescibacteria group bacterium]MCL5224167.1 prepilin peptidase [Patescibacteria group bacterium]